ncbi:VanZ family protein [Clostridium massiliodielmoense]|uniref:VanZ family protein n=1 Tax=Clostridium massiliodielmoense TaxID=1776385 RepID=UPI0004D64520|nr:VanZ family protein [Clostridium massiliodielmoense]KEH99104.1 VanZ family protein [Clostridium botulinum C/D str. BKT12695]
MKNIKFKNIVKYVLVIVWMIIIFDFSKDPATISDEKSGFVIEVLTNSGVDINGMFGKMSNFIIRKMGHFTEYFVLCILLIFALACKFKIKKTYIAAISITFLYACSDEFHQLFVPGRSGKIMDVLIDTTGGLVAIVIYKIVLSISNKNK